MSQRSSARAEIRVPAHRPQTSRPQTFNGIPSPLVDLALQFLASDAFEIACNIAAALKARGFEPHVIATDPAHDEDRDDGPAPGSTVWEPDGNTSSPKWRDIALARLSAYAERNTSTGCLIWRGATQQSGYGMVSFQRGRYTAHRLAWLAQRGPIPKGLFVCHTCDNRTCIEITHLFLGTPQDNTTDMTRKGRGKFFGAAHLTEAEAARIKRRLAEGESVISIAKDSRLSYHAIHNIKTNRSWRHVEAAPRIEDAPATQDNETDVDALARWRGKVE